MDGLPRIYHDKEDRAFEVRRQTFLEAHRALSIEGLWHLLHKVHMASGLRLQAGIAGNRQTFDALIQSQCCQQLYLSDMSKAIGTRAWLVKSK